VGEACHFIDLLRFLADAPITQHAAVRIDSGQNDTASIHLAFGDGSIGTIHYLSNGHKAYPKERLEIFADGRIIRLDNFRALTGFGWPGFVRMNLWRQNKGQKECVNAFLQAIRSGGVPPIAMEQVFEVAQVTIDVNEAVR
jgi:predicted dehydrogenase